MKKRLLEFQQLLAYIKHVHFLLIGFGKEEIYLTYDNHCYHKLEI